MVILQQWIIPGILFLVTVCFGFWVGKIGKPYNGLLFNLHKLMALGAAILTGIRIFEEDPFLTFPAIVIILVALALIGVMALFSTGAMLSIQQEVKSVAQWIHRISLIVAAGSLMAALFLLG